MREQRDDHDRHAMVGRLLLQAAGMCDRSVFVIDTRVRSSTVHMPLNMLHGTAQSPQVGCDRDVPGQQGTTAIVPP